MFSRSALVAEISESTIGLFKGASLWSRDSLRKG